MLEKLIELLTAIAMAVGGAAGVGVANEHATPAAESDSAALAEDAAIDAALAARADAAERAAIEVVGIETVDGLAKAADALGQAAENAPDEADQGLGQASGEVTTNPANEVETPAAGAPSEAPPIEVPADSSASESRPVPPAGRP